MPEVDPTDSVELSLPWPLLYMYIFSGMHVAGHLVFG